MDKLYNLSHYVEDFTLRSEVVWPMGVLRFSKIFGIMAINKDYNVTNVPLYKFKSQIKIWTFT